MRLLVARCEVLYTGRLTARLPEAVRLLMFKADGSFLVHDDAGGFRPLNCIRTAFRPQQGYAAITMCVVDSSGVRISYETIGKGRPLILLHGWGVDRTSWTGAGYIDELESDYRLVNIDIRGHGASDKPHEPAAYTADVLVRDVFAVADAAGLHRFGIWGHSYGGWIAWMTAAADPRRVAAIVTSGAWDPRPAEPSKTEDLVALRQGGLKALLDRMRIASGERFDREVPPWIEAIALRGDPEALFASYSKMWVDGLDDEALRSFPVPALLIAGELEDEGDAAAGIAAMIPSGQRLRLQGLGHVGTCNASALTFPTAREFLDRWVAR